VTSEKINNWRKKFAGKGAGLQRTQLPPGSEYCGLLTTVIVESGSNWAESGGIEGRGREARHGRQLVFEQFKENLSLAREPHVMV
jgi:hypothetical protein